LSGQPSYQPPVDRSRVRVSNAALRGAGSVTLRPLSTALTSHEDRVQRKRADTRCIRATITPVQWQLSFPYNGYERRRSIPYSVPEFAIAAVAAAVALTIILDKTDVVGADPEAGDVIRGDYVIIDAGLAG